MSEAGEAHPIVLYDGVCGLCNRLVQFLLKRDKKGRLRFASLQSDFATKVLTRHGIDPKDLDTVQVVLNYEQHGERVLNRSDAILSAGEELGIPWSALATMARIVPRALRDIVYGFVARNRYHVFGKYDTCMLPDPTQRHRFLDQSPRSM
jgi:predicted DCC family thiol-disulfide oxidoreductase YuxK